MVFEAGHFNVMTYHASPAPHPQADTATTYLCLSRVCWARLALTCLHLSLLTFGYVVSLVFCLVTFGLTFVAQVTFTRLGPGYSLRWPSRALEVSIVVHPTPKAPLRRGLWFEYSPEAFVGLALYYSLLLVLLLARSRLLP